MAKGLQPRPGILVLSVSELAGVVNAVLESTIAEAWVAGEISNLKMHSSGHWYFALKDPRSQISCVMFRGRNQLLRFRPEDGMQVLTRGRVSIYETRGALQFYVEAMEPHGLGMQQLALEQLKAKLQAEGLFDPERKRPLPFFPRRVGIITAGGGAAIHDMLVTLRQRCPSVLVIVRPVAVQGRSAAAEIVQALADFAELGGVDVVILGRGGGSAEDLAAFNDETLTRAIAATTVPIVSAVGHETDFTLADLVADQRAATPTAAATLVVPTQSELRETVDRANEMLGAALRRTLQRKQLEVTMLRARLRDPRQSLRGMQQRVDELADRFTRGMRQLLQANRLRLAAHSAQLDALSPLAVVARGYSIVRRTADNSLVRSAQALRPGDSLEIHFAEDRADVTVQKVHSPGRPQ